MIEKYRSPLYYAMMERIYGKRFEAEIRESYNWDTIRATCESTRGSFFNEYEIDDPERVGVCYIGSVFTVYPSGKFYTCFARSNVTNREILLDEIFQETFERVANEHNAWMSHGDYDPVDLYIVMQFDD